MTDGGSPFRGMVMRWNSAETQQSGNSPRSGPGIKDGRSCGLDVEQSRRRATVYLGLEIDSEKVKEK